MTAISVVMRKSTCSDSRWSEGCAAVLSEFSLCYIPTGTHTQTHPRSSRRPPSRGRGASRPLARERDRVYSIYLSLARAAAARPPRARAGEGRAARIRIRMHARA
jgi:hypothetical protein